MLGKCELLKNDLLEFCIVSICQLCLKGHPLFFFREATYSEEFLRLPADEVHALLIRDTIQVRVEEDVMDSIIRWYRWDMVSRKAQMSWLLNKCIRVGFLSDQAISRLRQDDANPDALEEVAQVLDALRQDPRQDRRRGLQQVLVVCGGEGQAVE